MPLINFQKPIQIDFPNKYEEGRDVWIYPRPYTPIKIFTCKKKWGWYFNARKGISSEPFSCGTLCGQLWLLVLVTGDRWCVTVDSCQLTADSRQLISDSWRWHTIFFWGGVWHSFIWIFLVTAQLSANIERFSVSCTEDF